MKLSTTLGSSVLLFLATIQGVVAQCDQAGCDSCKNNCGNTCGPNGADSGSGAFCSGCYTGCIDICSPCEAMWPQEFCRDCGGVFDYANDGTVGIGHCDGGSGVKCSFCERDLKCDSAECGGADPNVSGYSACFGNGPFNGCACE